MCSHGCQPCFEALCNVSTLQETSKEMGCFWPTCTDIRATGGLKKGKGCHRQTFTCRGSDKIALETLIFCYWLIWGYFLPIYQAIQISGLSNVLPLIREGKERAKLPRLCCGSHSGQWEIGQQPCLWIYWSSCLEFFEALRKEIWADMSRYGAETNSQEPKTPKCEL